jgi:hypothetical protein
MSLQPPLLFALAESRELGARIGEHLGLPLQGKFGTSMISKVKGKTEISRQPSRRHPAALFVGFPSVQSF